MVQFDITLIVLASVSVVGVVEWLKGLFPKETNTVVWRVVLLPVSVVVAVFAGGSLAQMATNSLALLAVTQIAYPLLIQLPSSIIGAVKNKLGGS